MQAQMEKGYCATILSLKEDSNKLLDIFLHTGLLCVFVHVCCVNIRDYSCSGQRNSSPADYLYQRS